MKKPLYRLPQVLTAFYVMIAEGEKDCDNLMVAMKDKPFPFAATTNFDGADKWREADAVFFAGKEVVICADNDSIGRKHADKVAASLYGLACGVKVIYFAELPEHGDVSDYLKANGIATLLDRIKATDHWRPAENANPLLVQARRFINTLPDNTNWRVEKLIETGANGFIAGVPKASKSFAAVDLAVSLAIGDEWLNFHIPRPVRTALISREDNPALTGWRIRSLAKGKSHGVIDLLDENLWVNTRAQSRDFKLDVEELCNDMTAELKSRRIEFAFFDVFNVLHTADENDNTEMRKVLERLTKIQSEVGCQIGVVHHFSKATGESLINRLRGSSAISGWAEWLVGISLVDPETHVRKAEFEAKVDEAPQPIYYRIVSDKDVGEARLVVCDDSGNHHSKREGSAAEKFM